MEVIMGQAKLRGTFKQRKAYAIEKENEFVLREYLLNSIDSILDGKGCDDFARSFSIVRKVDDLYMLNKGGD